MSIRRKQPLVVALAAWLSLAAAACSREAEPPADPATPPPTPAAEPAPPVADAMPTDAPVAQPIADAPPVSTVEPAGSVPPVAVPIGGCDAEAVKSLVGQASNETVIEQARRDSGVNTVRVLKPGEAATMDYRVDRLNVIVDDAGTITALRCG